MKHFKFLKPLKKCLAFLLILLMVVLGLGVSLLTDPYATFVDKCRLSFSLRNLADIWEDL